MFDFEFTEKLLHSPAPPDFKTVKNGSELTWEVLRLDTNQVLKYKGNGHNLVRDLFDR